VILGSRRKFAGGVAVEYIRAGHPRVTRTWPKPSKPPSSISVLAAWD
jgi:hypothetical protein